MNRLPIIFILLLVLVISCGKKKKQVPPISNDGLIIQKSSIKTPHNRLNFLGEYRKELKYVGHTKVNSFALINQNSIPIGHRYIYFKIELLDKNEKLLHHLYIRNPAFTTDISIGYLVYNYTSRFFVDIPEKIKLHTISKIILTPLNKKIKPMSVEADFTQPFDTSTNVPEGWNGKKRVLQLFGNTPPEKAFDIVVLGDGFTQEEMDTSSDKKLLESHFGKSTKKYILGLLNKAPYKKLKEK